MPYEESRIDDLLAQLHRKYQAGEIYSFIASQELRVMIARVIRESEYAQSCRDVTRRKVAESDRRALRAQLGLPVYIKN